MKLFCFFITIAIVNISADDEAHYNIQVARTNVVIELAYNKNDVIVGNNFQYNGLEYVIEKMINNTPSFNIVDYYKCFARMNFMIAVPDKTDLINHIPGSEYLVMHYPNLKISMLRKIQSIMQHEILCTLGIDIPEDDAGQNIDVPDDGAGQGVQSLNLTTLAEQRRCLVEIALKKIVKREIGSMYDQFIEQLEIRDTLNTERLNLTTLTEVRKVTGKSIENKIRHVLGTGTSKDDEDQRADVSEVVEDQRNNSSEDEEVQSADNFEDNQEQNRPPHDDSLFRICRLMGLYLSTKFPTSYIKEIQIDPINYTCTLNEDNLQRRFKKINGIWWQISSISLGAANTI